jgi:AcrR family transcriptional regulator
MAAGRPRTFDVDTALDKAMTVFWKHGYEGATIPELTGAMGINRPSLYAAFGNKESLFRKALDRYAAGPAAYVAEALAAPTARDMAERLLAGGIAMVTDPKNPGGCLAVQGALACAEGHDAVQRDATALRTAGEAAIRARLERARKEGDLPAAADPADLAKYLTVLSHGLAIQAAGGATKRQLQRVADMALRAWPKGLTSAGTGPGDP